MFFAPITTLCSDSGMNVGSARRAIKAKRSESDRCIARSPRRLTLQIRVSVEPPYVLGDEHIGFLS